MKKRILVTGANGLLGKKVVEVFRRESDYEIIPTSTRRAADISMQLDITNKENVREVFSLVHPDIIINTAAYTNVDKAEEEREVAYLVNATGVANLGEISRIHGSKVVHISTDYVFDGLKGNYTEESRPEPINYYGRTKLAGENLLKAQTDNYAIVRTQVLYGYARDVKKNFALWVIENLYSGRPIAIVTDQIGNPTLADELAYALLRVCEKDVIGVYHFSGNDALSRYDFAKLIADVFALPADLITPIKSPELNQTARRPTNSTFICLKAKTELGIEIPSTISSLQLMKQQMRRAGVITKV
ncbi:MAG: dTDP-4-dehydrorhamnose reductase [Candidatus Kryptoniota bacterium]